MTEENRKRLTRWAAVLICVLLLSIGLWKGTSPSPAADNGAASAAIAPPAQEQFALADGVQPPSDVLTGLPASTPSKRVGADSTNDSPKADAGPVTPPGDVTPGAAGGPHGASLYPPLNDLDRGNAPNGSATGGAGTNPGGSGLSGNSTLAGLGSSPANGAPVAGRGAGQGSVTGGSADGGQLIPFEFSGQLPSGTPYPDFQTADNGGHGRSGLLSPGGGSQFGDGSQPGGGSQGGGGSQAGGGSSGSGNNNPPTGPGTPFTDSGVNPKGSSLLDLDQPSGDDPPQSNDTPINNPTTTEQTNPLASVPEPAEVILLSIAAVMTLRRFKRLGFERNRH